MSKLAGSGWSAHEYSALVGSSAEGYVRVREILLPGGEGWEWLARTVSSGEVEKGTEPTLAEAKRAAKKAARRLIGKAKRAAARELRAAKGGRS